MKVKIERLPGTKPYSRVKSFCLHPHFPIIATSICEVKYYIRLLPYTLQKKPEHLEIDRSENSLGATSERQYEGSFQIGPAVFEKRSEMTKKLQWSANGFQLFQITSKGVKILNLSSKSSLGQEEFGLTNSDYAEDSSEIIAFASSSQDTYMYYATLDSKLVKYSLMQRTRVVKNLDSKTLAMCADPLDKHLVLLSLGKFNLNDF